MASERIAQLLNACDDTRVELAQLGAVVGGIANATITALNDALGAMATGADTADVTAVLTHAVAELRMATVKLSGGGADPTWVENLTTMYWSLGPGVSTLLICFGWSFCEGWRRWVYFILAALMCPYLGVCWLVVVASEHAKRCCRRLRRWSRRSPVAACLRQYCCCCCQSATDPHAPEAGDAEADQEADPTPGEGVPDAEDASSQSSTSSVQTVVGVGEYVVAAARAIGGPVVAAMATVVTAPPSFYRFIRDGWLFAGPRRVSDPSVV